MNDFMDYVIACALRWGVALVEDFLYWGIAHLVVAKIFSGTEGTPRESTS